MYYEVNEGWRDLPAVQGSALHDSDILNPVRIWHPLLAARGWWHAKTALLDHLSNWQVASPESPLPATAHCSHNCGDGAGTLLMSLGKHRLLSPSSIFFMPFFRKEFTCSSLVVPGPCCGKIAKPLQPTPKNNRKVGGSLLRIHCMPLLSTQNAQWWHQGTSSCLVLPFWPPKLVTIGLSPCD